MQDVCALLLVGGQVKELGVLLRRRSKAALPFAGMYRIVDFAMSNLSRSNVPIVGVLSQYRPSSLMDHVGIGRPWDYNQRNRHLLFLPPNQDRAFSGWYRGTADAVFQNLNFLARFNPQDVMVLSGDHVYHMDYRPLLEFHRRMDADLTMVFSPLDVGSPARFGIGVLDADNRVTDYQEKPEKPASNLASLTIYVFKRRVLEQRVRQNARTGRSFHLYDEVIPDMIHRGDKVFGYVFRQPWYYLRTLSEYHREHLRLARGQSDIHLDNPGVVTNLEVQGVGDAPAAMIRGYCQNTIVSPGVIMQGRAIDSVMSPWVTVGEAAVVERSVVMAGTRIGEGAVVRNAIIDKDCVVGRGAVVDGGPDGLCVIGRRASIEAGHRVGPTQVEPGVKI